MIIRAVHTSVLHVFFNGHNGHTCALAHMIFWQDTSRPIFRINLSHLSKKAYILKIASKFF